MPAIVLKVGMACALGSVLCSEKLKDEARCSDPSAKFSIQVERFETRTQRLP